jgi:hypothetical protein
VIIQSKLPLVDLKEEDKAVWGVLPNLENTYTNKSMSTNIEGKLTREASTMILALL